jgi:hypothetical protein
MCQIVSCQEFSQKRERESQSRRRSEFGESAVEGISLCQEDLVCECAVVAAIFKVTVRL